MQEHLTIYEVAVCDRHACLYRLFYYPDLLRAACHFCNHLPGDRTMQDIVERFPFPALVTCRLIVPPHESSIYLRDLDKNRAPKGLHRRRQGRNRVVSMGAAHLARQIVTLALLRDSIDTEMAQNIWQRAATGQFPCYGEYTGGSLDDLELREVARDVLLQRSTADRRAALEWEATMTGVLRPPCWREASEAASQAQAQA